MFEVQPLGSLIVYLLLGGVDPVANDLLFERFINDGRGDMPDIDIDFDSERRDEVINYVLGYFQNKRRWFAQSTNSSAGAPYVWPQEQWVIL